VTHPDVLGVLAFLLVAGSMGLWFRRIQRVEVPTDRRGWVASWLLGAALGVAALGSGAGWVGGVAAALAVLAGVFFSVLVAVSAQRAAADAIRVGEMLRDFTALDDRGELFSIASTAGRPLLLKFFRGHW
jgi:hypothetical protein